MSIFQAVILGALQGVTEFLPISSSAHLILVPWFFGWPDQGLTFDVVLHAGTLFAILSFFWKDWLQMVTGLLSNQGKEVAGQYASPRLLLLLVCGTLPAALAGYFAEKAVETWLRSPLILSFTLIGLAMLLWLAERIALKKRELTEVSLVDALTVGTAQALALIPGTSRSGITITAGLFRGLTREASARFSFLLAAPITAGAALKKAMELHKTGVADTERLPMVLGFLASVFVGYLTIKYLLRYLQKNTLFLFIYYRIALGCIILILIWFAGFRP
jgi:undecaprenyl-diphosphatase